jgi:multidrug efflux pump subunit AcrA (membrane-fusion protein)
VIAVPTQAIGIGPAGRLVYVVEKDDKVTSKPVKVTYEYLGTSVITGINVGDRIVVEGKQNLRTGSKVREAKAPKSEKPPADKTTTAEPK